MKGLGRLARPMSALKRQISIESRVETTVEEDSTEGNFRTQLGSPASNSEDGGRGGWYRQPRPSSSSTDPLNWPLWKKELAYISFLIAAGTSSYLKLILASTNAVLSNEFDVSYLYIVCLTGVPLILGAMTSLGSSALGRVVGRRAILMLGTVFAFVGVMWNMKIGDMYGQFLAARVFQGLGWGMIDGVVSHAVDDLFFYQQARARMNCLSLCTTVATWSGPILSGRLAESRNWRHAFLIAGIMQGISLLLVSLAAPETQYTRTQQPVTASPRTHKRTTTNLSTTEAVTLTTISSGFTPTENTKSAFGRSLLFPRPAKSCSWLLPLKAIITPSTFISVCLVGPLTAATYGLASSVALLFSIAPTLLKPQRIGYLFILPALFAVICHLVQSSLFLFSAKRPSMKPRSKTISILVTGQVLLLGAGGVVALGLYTCAKVGPQMVTSSEVVSIVDGEMLNESRLWVVGGLLGAAAAGAVGVSMLARSLALSSFEMTRLLIDGRPEYVAKEIEISRLVAFATQILTNILSGAFTLAFPSWVVSVEHSTPPPSLTGPPSSFSSAGPWKRHGESSTAASEDTPKQLGLGMLMGVQITSVALGIVIMVVGGAAAVILVSGAEHLRRRDRKILGMKSSQDLSKGIVGLEMNER